jgi:hypothetical protein
MHESSSDFLCKVLFSLLEFMIMSFFDVSSISCPSVSLSRDSPPQAMLRSIYQALKTSSALLIRSVDIKNHHRASSKRTLNDGKEGTEARHMTCTCLIRLQQSKKMTHYNRLQDQLFTSLTLILLSGRSCVDAAPSV